jgi:tetratricopeptide (TPR) repeat protein
MHKRSPRCFAALTAVAMFAALAAAQPADAPRYPRKAPARVAPILQRAEALWAQAAAERDRVKAIALWRKAGAAFTRVARDKTAAAPIRREAAYAAVLAYKNAIESGPRVRAAPRPSGQPPAMTADERALLAAFADFLAVAPPADPERVLVQLLQARLYWEHDDFGAAVPLLEDIVDHHPRADAAEFALNLLLDAFNRQQKFAALARRVDASLADPKLVDGRAELRERLIALRVAGLRKRAEDRERAKDYAGCGRAYWAIVTQHPKAPRADELLYNAGICFEHAGMIDEAKAAHKRLIRGFRRSALRPRSQQILRRLREAAQP